MAQLLPDPAKRDELSSAFRRFELAQPLVQQPPDAFPALGGPPAAGRGRGRGRPTPAAAPPPSGGWADRAATRPGSTGNGRSYIYRG